MIKSFQYAIQGLFSALKSEVNMRRHLAVAALVTAAGFWLQLTLVEWCVIILCIVLVIGFELFNTSLEQLCNHITAGEHPAIKKIKDISAAAVFLAAIGSVAAGVLIFLPKLLDKFQG